MTTIRIEVVRALLFKSARVEAGQRLDLDPADAADLLCTNRARLLDPTDGPTVEKRPDKPPRGPPCGKPAGRRPGWRPGDERGLPRSMRGHPALPP